MGRQKRIQIGNKDYYLDLLFYHRKMRRLVLIELKLGEFEEESIAIILCVMRIQKR